MADPNPRSKDGKTPMHLAALNGHANICSLIADHSSNPNQGDEFGNTPLHEAARRGHTEVYQEIMDLVEDKNPARTDSGITPLHLSAAMATTLLPNSFWKKQRTTVPGTEWATIPQWSLPLKKATGKYAFCSRSGPTDFAVILRGKTSGFFSLESLGSQHSSPAPPTPLLKLLLFMPYH